MEFFHEPKHEKLTDFYFQNDLEIEPGWEETAFFSVSVQLNGKRIGAATFSKRVGIVLLDYIAVDPAFRKSGVGRELFFYMLSQMKDVKSIYLVARTLGFFQALGCCLDESKPELLRECVRCPQYQNGCHPVVMRYDREEKL